MGLEFTVNEHVLIQDKIQRSACRKALEIMKGNKEIFRSKRLF